MGRDGDGTKQPHPLPFAPVCALGHVVPRVADTLELVIFQFTEVVEREADTTKSESQKLMDPYRLFFSASTDASPLPDCAEDMASFHAVMSSGVMLSAKSIRDMPNSTPSRFDADTVQHQR